MQGDLPELLVRQSSRLVEDHLADSDLPQIVEHRGLAEELDLLLLEMHRLPDGHGIHGYPLGVAPRIEILGFQGLDQGVDRPDVHGVDEVGLLLDLLLQVRLVILDLLLEGFFPYGILDRDEQDVEIERLGDVIAGPDLDCGHRGVEFRVGRHHDARDVGEPRRRLPEEGDTIHLRHPDIGKEDGVAPGGQLGQRVLPVDCFPYRISFNFKAFSDNRSDGLLVVDDEDRLPVTVCMVGAMSCQRHKIHDDTLRQQGDNI